MTVTCLHRPVASAAGTAALRDLPRPVAWVLGGGGACGAAQVGAVHALVGRGLVPDLVVGTSVGALNGVVVAAHVDGAAPMLDRMWAGLRCRDVFPLGWPVSRGSIFDDRGLRRLFARSGLPSEIEQLTVPFTAVAMDLASGSEVRLDHGDLESALLASAAIPGILPPVDRDGRRLVDGAPVASVPVRAALAQGAASALVLSAGTASWPASFVSLRRAGAVAARVKSLRAHQQVERDLLEVSQHIPTVVLPTGVATWPSPWDFGQSRRLITTAFVATGRFVEGLRVDGPGLYRDGALIESAAAAAATHGPHLMKPVQTLDTRRTK